MNMIDLKVARGGPQFPRRAWCVEALGFDQAGGVESEAARRSWAIFTTDQDFQKCASVVPLRLH
jgi:hypothetical protein